MAAVVSAMHAKPAMMNDAGRMAVSPGEQVPPRRPD
jgi:hypothetical protein